MTSPTIRRVLSDPARPDHLQVVIDTTEGEVTILVTDSTPGASDGLAGDPQPILVVWQNPTAPVVRVALRDRLVAAGWAPFVAAEPTMTEGEARMMHGDR